jgi:hypothetical protein
MKSKLLLSVIGIFVLPFIGFSQIWDNVIQNIDTTGTINLTDASWNNTLIKNCTIHNTGTGNDGIFLRNVANVRIENCIIYNIDGQAGIRLSISGIGTDSVQIINNTLYNLKENGISAPQRSQNSVPLNQESLEIIGNTVYNSGLGSSSGLNHSIYCQAGDFTIKENLIFGTRDGNGISVRSSGIISGNIISGESKSNKPAIRYYSDHFTGNSNTLLVENNIIYNDSSDAHTLDIFDFASLYQNSSGDNHIVKNFNIRFNTIVSLHPNKYALKISNDFNQSAYSIIVEGNLIINPNGISQCASAPSNTVQNFNLLVDNLSDFNSNIPPYDFHIISNNNAIDYVGNNSTNFPLFDIDGEIRPTDSIDAGADQYYSATTGIIALTKKSNVKVFPNPITQDNQVTVEMKEDVQQITIYNSNGQVIFNKEFNSRANTITIEIPNDTNGLCLMLINKKTTVPLIVKKK